MNKSNIRQKRSLGKESPLSKRPKLDLTLKSKEHFRDNKFNSNEFFKDCNEAIKEKISSSTARRNVQENTSNTSDWDEDFSGDMLEKVCLIADLSQAMVNNEPVSNDISKGKVDFEVLENNKGTTRSKLIHSPSESSVNSHDCMKIEIERLQEKLKTKEGEVHILRSQLRQSENAKQALALQNIKIVEEIQKKCNEKINLTEKELESTKSKLLFKDLEYKTLSERCRQLEYNISKNTLNEVNMTKSSALSQVVHQNFLHKEINEKNPPFISDDIKNSLINIELPKKSFHEGKYLAKIICPEFFKFTSETSEIAFYNFHSEIDNPRAKEDLEKKEKCKRKVLPKQTVFIKDFFNSVSTLFACSNFSQKEAKKIVENLINSCMEILIHLKQVLLFLVELQLCNDSDKADQYLLQNEEEIRIVTMKNLIDGEKLNEEECGIEGRRSLALLYALIITSKFAFNLLKNNLCFMELIKNLTTAIGTLRKPLRYNGILVGITLILQKVLEEEELTNETLKLINGTVEEIIFSRPKLDVLLEVINVLTAGNRHMEFLISLCRKDSVDSCTLYMDCKLKQAMFFTKDTCPLKLLCMQIMGLATLPSSKVFRLKTTKSIIKWLNSAINTSYFRKIKWLPVNSVFRQEGCFNVTDCLMYLLTLCLKDYFEVSSRENVAYETSVIGEGSVLLKRILKADQGHLNDNNYCLRFATLLKSFLPNKTDVCEKTHMTCMSSLQVEAIHWITDLLENDHRNQDCFFKQNTSAISDVDFFNALKINDDSKIY